MELENCDFIRKNIPFGYKSRNCLYQLIDNYTLFYFKFMKNSAFDEKFWENGNNQGKINAWCGIAFERVCLEHIAQIKNALGISGVQTDVNSWQCDSDPDEGIFGSQIDLLIARKDQVINICEMKYSKTEFMADASYDRAQRRRISDFLKKTKTKFAIHPTLITPYGLVENSYSGEIQSVITAEDLFK